jgi:hypothetical protein
MLRRCPKCSAPVYAPERVFVGQRVWHRACLCCHTCSRSLDAALLNEVSQTAKHSFKHKVLLVTVDGILFFTTTSHEAESEDKHGVWDWDPVPELTITLAYIHSRIDYSTFTMGNLNLMPESIDFILQSGTLDLAYGFTFSPHSLNSKKIEERYRRCRLCTLYFRGGWFIQTL